MKNFPKPSNYTQKSPVLQKFGFAMKWIGLFLGLMIVGMVLGPFFLASHQRALYLSDFFDHYKVVFWVCHAVFILSTLWWWPAYIRARGARNQWPQEMIRRGADWKWAVMLVLAFLCILFFVS